MKRQLINFSEQLQGFMFNCDPAGIARFFFWKSTEGKCKELLASWPLMKKRKGKPFRFAFSRINSI